MYLVPWSLVPCLIFSSPTSSTACARFDQRAGRSIRTRDAGAMPAPGPLDSAATSEPSLADGVTRFLTFHEEFFVGHDGLAGVVGLPVLDVGVVVGNTDHEAGRAHRPFLMTYEKRHDVRHCCL